MAPRSIWAFASGSNAPGEIVGFARAGIPPGVAMLRWDKEQEEFKWSCGYVEARGAPRSCWLALRDTALQLRIPVFADSGAYSEYVAGKPIPAKFWRAMLADQLDLARNIGPLAVIVLPDKVGDQAGTLRRLRKYRDEINAILDTGARGIVALQPGRRGDTEMAEEISSILGRRDWVVGFPTTARARRDPAEIRATLEAFPWLPAGVHLLGLSPAARDWSAYMTALRPLPPDVWASSDTVAQRRLVGRAHTTEKGRQYPLGPLTEQEDIAKAELLEEAWGGVSDPLVGAQIDPTEQLPFPGDWMPKGVAQEIARAGVAAGRLTTSEAVAFAADPTAARIMVQERDDPGAEWWLDQEIERAWWANLQQKRGGLSVQLRKERGRRGLFGERGPTPERLPEFGQMELGVPRPEPEDNPARTFADSPNLAVVLWNANAHSQTFTLIDPTRPDYLASGSYSELPVAFLSINHNDEIPGLDSWMVTQAGARRGYGPIAYETALEFLRRRGPQAVLMPHVDVSEDATRVWVEFAKRDYRELYPEAVPAELMVHDVEALNAAYSLRVPLPGYDAALRKGEAFAGQQAAALGIWASEVRHLVMEEGESLFRSRMKGMLG